MKTNKARRDNLNFQSPWASAPEDREFEEMLERAGGDADRLEATSDDDRRWFEQHSKRRFYLRHATPHERFCGFALDWVLVVRVPSFGRLRMPVSFDGAELSAPEEYNTEAHCARLFVFLTEHFTPSNTHPGLFALVRRARKAARHG